MTGFERSGSFLQMPQPIIRTYWTGIALTIALVIAPIAPAQERSAWDTIKPYFAPPPQLAGKTG